jgi:hypothetical protein
MLRGFFLASMMIPATGLVLAQHRYDRDDRFDPGRGWRFSRAGIVDRSIADLRSIASDSFLNRYQRAQFDRAVLDLHRFREGLQNGRFEQGRLDRAIGSMSSLAGSRELRRPDRERLWRDVSDLRDLRAQAYRGPYVDGFRR